MKPTSPVSPGAGAKTPPGTGEVGNAEESKPVLCSNAWVGDRQEEEDSSSPVGNLRWRLWHQGKVSAPSLGFGKGCLPLLGDVYTLN